MANFGKVRLFSMCLWSWMILCFKNKSSNMMSKWPLEGSNSYCFTPKSVIQSYGRFVMIQSNQWKVSLQHPQQFGTAVLSLTHKGLKWVTHSKPLALHFHQYSSCIKRKLVTKQSPLKSSFRFHTPSIYIRPCYGCVFYMLYCNLCGCV